MPAAPAANAGISRPARPRGAPVVRTAVTACPVDVWWGAPISRSRPNMKSSERHRGDQDEERGRGKGRGYAGEERGDQPGCALRDWGRRKKAPRAKQCPTPPATDGNQQEIEEGGRRRKEGHGGWERGERGCAQVRPNPRGLTSPGGLRRLGPRKPGHSSGRRDKGCWEVARLVA